MDTLLRQIAVALCSSAIVWAIWFFIAKSKNNHKQMVYATVFCCFVFFTMAFSPLAGAAFYGAYALINYVKKMGDAPTQAQQEPQQMQIPLPEEKKEEIADKKSQDEKVIPRQLMTALFIMLGVFSIFCVVIVIILHLI